MKQSRHTMSGDEDDGWNKVLYLKQGFPDDYVPQSFLKDLRKNGQ